MGFAFKCLLFTDLCSSDLWVCCDKWVWVFHQPLGSATDTAFSPTLCGIPPPSGRFPSEPSWREVSTRSIDLLCMHRADHTVELSEYNKVNIRLKLNFLKRSQVNPSISAHAKI